MGQLLSTKIKTNAKNWVELPWLSYNPTNKVNKMKWEN